MFTQQRWAKNGKVLSLYRWQCYQNNSRSHGSVKMTNNAVLCMPDVQ